MTREDAIAEVERRRASHPDATWIATQRARRASVAAPLVSFTVTLGRDFGSVKSTLASFVGVIATVTLSNAKSSIVIRVGRPPGTVREYLPSGVVPLRFE